MEDFMFVDLLGKTRVKLGLHSHTANADGYLGIEERAQRYIDKGYDAIAVTDPWKYTEEGESEGLKIISGCEYNVGGIYRVVAVGMTSDPKISPELQNMVRTSRAKTADLVKRIHLFNGFAFISRSDELDTPEGVASVDELDGIEIYGADFTRAAFDEVYLGDLVDGVMRCGKAPVILASDGIICDDEENGTAVMVESVDMQTSSIIRALKNGRFYSSQGPEIHLIKLAPDKVKVVCTPAARIEFICDDKDCGKEILGDGLIEAEYTVSRGERFIRAEVTDADGLMAWSNVVDFDELYR